MPTRHQRRQAPTARRPRRDAHLAMRHADLREPDRQLPATPPADPPGAPQRLTAEPPASTPPPLSDFDYLSYSLNQRTKGTLGTSITRRLTTPRTAARASRTSPSPPAVPARQSTHAPRGTAGPAPVASTLVARLARPISPAGPTPPDPCGPSRATSPWPRPTNDDRSPRPTSITFRTHLTNESKRGSTRQSPGYLTTPRLTTPRTAAPTDLAVGPEVAKNVLDVKVHT